MESQIKIVLTSFMVSVIVALIILPILRKLKIGQIEREYGPRSHLVKQGTPTMGGIIIAITLVILTAILYSSNKSILPLTVIIIGFGAVGFVDDFKKLVLRDTKGLKPAYKILRVTCNISNICIIFDKDRNRNRNNNTRIKNFHRTSSFNLSSFYYSCNACSNKCSQLNRWNRWLSK